MKQKLHTFFHPYRIRNQLMVLFITSALFPLLIFGFVLFISSNHEMESEVAETYTELSHHVNAMFTEYVSSIDSIARSVDATDAVSDYLRMNTGYFDHSVDEQILASNSALYFLKQIYDMNSGIQSVSAVTVDGDMLCYSANGYERSLQNWEDEYYDPLRESTGNTVILPVRETTYCFSSAEPVFTIGIRHMDKFSDEQSDSFIPSYTGYILIECPMEKLADICANIDGSKTCSYYMIDDGKKLFYTNDPDAKNHRENITILADTPENWNAQSISGDKCVIAGNYSEETGYTVLAYVPYKNVITRLSDMRVMFVIMCSVSLILMFLASFIAARNFTKPILQVQDAMKDVGNGNLTRKINETRNDEFGILYGGFNNLTEQLDSLLDKLADARQSEESARYHMLVSQINPHFLYNTLDSIRMMAVMQGEQEIAKNLLYLSDLFRYVIRQRGEPVTIREELNYAKKYLSIQQLRFQEDLEVRYDVDESTLDCKMPKLLLQPILENAFSHAFVNMEYVATLTLSIQQVKRRIVFTISDNGVGMHTKELNALRKRLAATVSSHVSDTALSDSIGLANVHQRLCMTFSSKHGLQIESDCAQGTRVTFSIPNNYERK